MGRPGGAVGEGGVGGGIGEKTKKFDSENDIYFCSPESSKPSARSQLVSAVSVFS